eukprot:1155518-Pelagomonas_calceolata.AAC.7
MTLGRLQCLGHHSRAGEGIDTIKQPAILLMLACPQKEKKEDFVASSSWSSPLPDPPIPYH